MTTDVIGSHPQAMRELLEALAAFSRIARTLQGVIDDARAKSG